MSLYYYREMLRAFPISFRAQPVIGLMSSRNPRRTSVEGNTSAPDGKEA